MYNLADMLLMFFVYAFLGWCLEIGYNGIAEGHYVNRGFLNGPVCPIYGVGAAVVILALTPLKNGGHVLLLFFVAALICTAIELVTGYILEKMYKTRWWDYSGKPLNLGGYICLEFSVYWGAACMGLMYGLHPLIYNAVLYKLPTTVKVIIISVFGIIFIIDLIATVITLKQLTGRVEKLAEMGKELLEISEKLGHKVYDGAVDVEKKYSEVENSERVKQLRARHDELKEHYEKIISEKHRSHEHVLKAFRTAHSEKYDEIYKKLREKISKK